MGNESYKVKPTCHNVGFPAEPCHFSIKCSECHFFYAEGSVSIEEKVKSVFDRQEGGSHYDLPIDTALFCIKNKIEAAEAAIIKYAIRHERKNKVEDIKKLIHYAQMILEVKYNVYSEFTVPEEPRCTSNL